MLRVGSRPTSSLRRRPLRADCRQRAIRSLAWAGRLSAPVRGSVLAVGDALRVSAASVADDLGYVALSDLARALGDIPREFRVIGGHMVTVLGARWQLGHELHRETGDVDLGITPIVARDHHVVGRLKDLDYTQVAGTTAQMLDTAVDRYVPNDVLNS